MSSRTATAATNEETEPVLVPKLRFPEFQDAGDWEEDELGAVCELYQPVTLSSSELSMTGEYLVYGANGVVGTHNKYNHEDAEIAVTCRGATCGEVTTTKPQSWITGNAMIVRPRDSRIRKEFIFHYFKNHGLKTVISGSAQPQITRTGFAPLVIFFPQPVEQQRIAECLSSLDELLAAQARKVEALKTHKKGLMQQLFPREGETQPRLRFPEFQNAGEWEQTSLGRVARLRNGYAFKSAEYVDNGPYKIITIANVQQGNLAIESTKRMAALPCDIQQHQVLSLGDILISMTGNVGRVCRVTAEGLLLNQRVGKLVPGTIDNVFFYHLLQGEDFRGAMQLRAAGGAQGNLSASDIVEYPLNSPTSLAEQQRIAECLSSLDARITAETQKLEALKIHKRGLMQQLFPSPQQEAS